MQFSAAYGPAWANKEHTAINITLESDQFGTIPFTATQADPEAHGRELFSKAARGDFGPVAEYVAPDKTLEKIEQEITEAVRSHLDAVVQLRGYDSIVAACSYAASTTPTYKAEGEACVEWRDKVWGAAFSVMAEIKAGVAEYGGADAVIAALPVIAWPAV